METTTTFSRLDRVRLGNRKIFIVTGYHPNRPVNCFSGVPENGSTEYVFGPNNRPVKIGVVTEDHPALVRLRMKKSGRLENTQFQGRSWQPLENRPHSDPNKKAVVTGLVAQLLMAVEANNPDGAKKLAADLRQADVLTFLQNV